MKSLDEIFRTKDLADPESRASVHTGLHDRGLRRGGAKNGR
jgi:hypothetical protein